MTTSNSTIFHHWRGTKHLKIPPRSSRANTYAERFVLTARPEVANRMLIFGQRRLRAVLAGYEAHYNGRRPHGGLINEYERAV
jgi:putative transposase